MTKAERKIEEYLREEGEDSDRSKRLETAASHYRAFLLTGDKEYKKAARTIWKEFGLSKGRICDEIEDAKKTIEIRDTLRY